MVSDYDPRLATFSIILSCLRYTCISARKHILNGVDFIVSSIDGAYESVVGYIFKVSTIFEPGTCRSYVVCCTFSFDLYENWQIVIIPTIPSRERLQPLD